MSGNGKLAAQLSEIVFKRLQEDRLVLPTLPTAAQKCLDMLRDPNVNLRAVAQALELDPLLAARVLRLASSAGMGGQSITSVEKAVSRVGAQKLKTLLVDASARRLFESNDRRICEAFKRLWEHSLAVALLARDVAALCGAQDTDTAYLAGLLHDIGKPVLAAMMLEAERMIVGSRPSGWIGADEWLRSIQSMHRRVGQAIAEAWKLPPAVARVIADASDYEAADRKSAVNAVCFANALAKQQGYHSGSGDGVDDEANTLVMIGRSLLGIDEEPVKLLVTNLRERLRVDAA